MGMSGKTAPSEIPSAFSSPVEKVFSSTIKRKQKTPSDKPKNISESTAYVMKMLGNVVRKGKLKLINQSKSYLIMTDDNCVRIFPDNTPVIFLQRCLFFSFRDPQCRNKARLHQGESLHCRPCYITEKMAAGIERRGRKRKSNTTYFRSAGSPPGSHFTIWRSRCLHGVEALTCCCLSLFTISVMFLFYRELFCFQLCSMNSFVDFVKTLEKCADDLRCTSFSKRMITLVVR